MSVLRTDRVFSCVLAAALLLPVEITAQQTGTSSAPKGNSTGASSSAHRPKLRRRTKPASETPDDAAPAETVDASADASAESSSSSDDRVAQTPAITVTEADLTAGAKVPAEARRAVAITGRELDFHLNTHTGVTEVRAQVTVRNGGATPLRLVPLKVSGALKWESARLMDGGATLPLEQHHLRDDLDHTGVSTEVALALPEPLAPGASARLDLFYGGVLAESSSRLLEMGAPVEAAVRTDWDTVTDAFTGLRGLGNVLWYPVSGEPALLRNGAAVPIAVQESRMREAESTFGLRLTLEYEGARPDAAFLCGDRQALTAAADGVATVEWKAGRLGLRTPSLFVTLAAPQEVAGGLARVVTDQADHAGALGETVARLKPMMEEWLGSKPSRVLDVIDLPIPDAAGFSDGSLLVAPLRTTQPEAMAPSLVTPLASAWLPEGIAAPWLREGIPAFLQAVWAERSSGRPAALAGLAAESTRLKKVESADAPQESSSSSNDVPVADAPMTPLAVCADPACDRGRAAYVLEMLRGMIGDTGLQGALSGWRVAEEDKTDSAAEETALLEGLLQQVAGNTKLDWFFQSWIDGNGSLPQLSIVAVAPRKIERGSAPANLLPQRQQPFAGPIGTEPVAPPDDPRMRWGGDKEIAQAGSWLVAVEVQNAGGTDVQVPVTVRAGSLTNTLPLRVPAHGKATIRVPFEAEPEEVLVNDGSVPEAETSIHRVRIGSSPAR